jgi:hypothetical protein
MFYGNYLNIYYNYITLNKLIKYYKDNYILINNKKLNNKNKNKFKKKNENKYK